MEHHSVQSYPFTPTLPLHKPVELKICISENNTGVNQHFILRWVSVSMLSSLLCSLITLHSGVHMGSVYLIERSCTCSPNPPPLFFSFAIELFSSAVKHIDAAVQAGCWTWLLQLFYMNVFCSYNKTCNKRQVAGTSQQGRETRFWMRSVVQAEKEKGNYFHILLYFFFFNHKI